MVNARTGRTRSPLLVAALGAAGLGVLCACPVMPADDGDKRAVVVRYVDKLVLPALADMHTAATSLSAAAVAHAATGGVAGPTRDDARAAWLAAMTKWQRLEMMGLGPAGSPATFVGGAGLRDLIYAWPQANPCGVDQQLVSDVFEEPGWAAARLVNILGLGSLEYVLFSEGEQNACPGSASINRDGLWDALSPAEVADRRARYAAVLAREIAAQVDALSSAWNEGGFAAELKGAGQGSSRFTSAQNALDQIYAALFAIELATKDKRLGIPAGLHVDCPSDSCPQKAESRYSSTSKDNILANLLAVRAVFIGLDAQDAEGVGFDDLLADRGASDLASSMTTHLTAVIDQVTAFDGTLEAALGNEPARVRALYDALKLFTDDLKSTMPSTLGLRVPDEGAGDND